MGLQYFLQFFINQIMPNIFSHFYLLFATLNLKFAGQIDLAVFLIFEIWKRKICYFWDICNYCKCSLDYLKYESIYFQPNICLVLWPEKSKQIIFWSLSRKGENMGLIDMNVGAVIGRLCGFHSWLFKRSLYQRWNKSSRESIVQILKEYKSEIYTVDYLLQTLKKSFSL